MNITVVLNGAETTFECEAYETLLAVLRRNGFVSIRYGSDTGETGASAVLIDGRLVNTDCLLAAQADGQEVTTIEGLADGETLHPMQEAFRECHALQCGYCTPGMVMAAISLLDEVPNPTELEVREGLEGNLCRCTGYHNIVKAVLQASGSQS